MGKFVKGFMGKTQRELTDEINKYAKRNNLDIVNLSYTGSNAYHMADKALVVFDGEEPVD